jgi:signal transduction histidine kinase/ActR/RegA family two-component response regulator
MLGKIRTRLTVTFIGLAVLPILLLGSFIAVKSYKAAQQEAMNITRETALRVAGEVDNFIRGMVDHIEIVSMVYGLQDLTRSKQQEVLNELLAFQKAYDVMTLLDPLGNELVQVNRTLLVRENDLGNRADKEEFLQPLHTKEIYFGPVLFRQDTGEPYMTCSVPYIDPQTGNVSGIIVGELRLKRAWDLFATLHLRPGEQVYITDDQGLVIAHQNPSIVLRGTTIKFDQGAASRQHTHSEGLLGGHAIIGVQHIVLGDQHLHIISEWDERYALAQAQRMVLIIGMGTLVALLAAVLAMIPVVGTIVRPLQKLAITARKIEDGDLSLQAEVTGNDEIGELAHAFNEMTTKLHGSMTDLQIEVKERAVIQKALERELLINESLASLSRVMLATEDTKELCDEVLMRAQALTTSEHGYVGYIDQKTGNLVCPTISSMMGKDCQITGEDLKVEFPLKAEGHYGHLWGASLNSKEPLFSNSPSTHPASKGCPAGHVPIHRFLSIPVLFHDKLVGQIAVANASADYQPRDIEALERLGHLYALALNRAHTQQEREVLLSELRQAQKMEAIGTLAGGIAHDFNNILTPILGYSEIALLSLDPEDQLYGDIQAIYQAGDRAKELINRILAFSRQHEDELSPLMMQPILKETIKLLRSTLPTTIEIRQNIDPNCGAVISDLTQFQQIIMNLSTNASHAMETSGGILEISLQEIKLSMDDALIKQGLSPGATACLTISDTGCGMDKATLARIFDPYFTTKEQGKGTGMGLAMVHGIVHSHHGHITVYSEPGKGTSFRIYFPIVSTETESKVAAPLASTVGGTERILLVDDEKAIATMLSTMLERLGYHVQPITDSVEALEMFKAQPELYDLVITDQTMPHLTGGELAKELLAIRADIPIILCTGFSASFTEELAKKIGIREYLMKPVIIQELTEKIRAALKKG